MTFPYYSFLTPEGFVFSHVADEGFIDGCAGPLLRYRKNIGADHVKVFVDIKKKHRWWNWNGLRKDGKTERSGRTEGNEQKAGNEEKEMKGMKEMKRKKEMK